MYTCMYTYIIFPKNYLSSILVGEKKIEVLVNRLSDLLSDCVVNKRSDLGLQNC